MKWISVEMIVRSVHTHSPDAGDREKSYNLNFKSKTTEPQATAKVMVQSWGFSSCGALCLAALLLLSCAFRW